MLNEELPLDRRLRGERPAGPDRPLIFHRTAWGGDEEYYPVSNDTRVRVFARACGCCTLSSCTRSLHESERLRGRSTPNFSHLTAPNDRQSKESSPEASDAETRALWVSSVGTSRGGINRCSANCSAVLCWGGAGREAVPVMMTRPNCPPPESCGVFVSSCPQLHGRAPSLVTHRFANSFSSKIAWLPPSPFNLST